METVGFSESSVTINQFTRNHIARRLGLRKDRCLKVQTREVNGSLT
jgi:hypothetical protein